MRRIGTETIAGAVGSQRDDRGREGTLCWHCWHHNRPAVAGGWGAAGPPAPSWQCGVQPRFGCWGHFSSFFLFYCPGTLQPRLYVRLLDFQHALSLGWVYSLFPLPLLVPPPFLISENLSPGSLLLLCSSERSLYG